MASFGSYTEKGPPQQSNNQEAQSKKVAAVFSTEVPTMFKKIPLPISQD